MDGLGCLGDTLSILLRCGGLQTLLRFLCLGRFSSSLFYPENAGFYPETETSTKTGRNFITWIIGGDTSIIGKFKQNGT